MLIPNIIFIKFNVAHQKQQKRENLPYFWKKGTNTPKKWSDLHENDTFRFVISENSVLEVSTSYLHNRGIYVFRQERNQKL